MAWLPTIVLRFIKVFPTSTNVAQVDTDAGEGFLKAMGNPEGPHALACELVGTMLAEWLGLRTLNYAVVEVTPEDEIPLNNGALADPGPAFITQAEQGFPWGGEPETLLRAENHQDCAKLVALDTWIRNCDRYRPEPRFRMNRDNVFLSYAGEGGDCIVLKAIDHTHAFTCGGELTRRIGHISGIQDATVFGAFPEFVPLLYRTDVRSAADRLIQMDREQADGFVKRVPEEWQVGTQVRDAWSSFIAQRAAFVAANIEEWLFHRQPGRNDT